MGFWRNTGIGSSLLAFLMGSTASIDIARAETAGTVGSVNQNATGQPAGGSSRTLGVGNSIAQNERVSTDANGTIHIMFNDRSALNVGRNSSVVIDRFVYNPTPGTGDMAVSLTRGAARFVGGQVSHSTGATIKTPAATVGVRGGNVTIIVDGNRTFVLVHSGVATVSNAFGTQVVRAGMQVAIPNGQAPSSPQQIDMGLLRTVNQQLTSQGRQTGGAAQPPTDGQVSGYSLGLSRPQVQTPNFDAPAAGDDLARGYATTVNQSGLPPY